MATPEPRSGDRPLPDAGLSPAGRAAIFRGLTKIVAFVVLQVVCVFAAVAAFFLVLFMYGLGGGDAAYVAKLQQAAATTAVVVFLTIDLLGVGLLVFIDRRSKRA